MCAYAGQEHMYITCMFPNVPFMYTRFHVPYVYRTTITLWLEGLRADWNSPTARPHQAPACCRSQWYFLGCGVVDGTSALKLSEPISSVHPISWGKKTWSSMTYHQIMYRYVSMELCISKTHHWKPTEGPHLSCMNPLGISLQDHLLNFQGANLRLKAHVQHSIRLIQDQKPGPNHDEPRWDLVISHRSGKPNNMWVMTIGRYYPVSWWIFADMFDSQMNRDLGT
jgi:hypothetical protein